jgi:hypothetical protein
MRVNSPNGQPTPKNTHGKKPLEEVYRQYHSFSVGVASHFNGANATNKATLLKEIYTIADWHRAQGKEAWVYYSSSALAAKFPYMNPKNIRRWMSEIEQGGWWKSAVRNKKKYDQTKSYLIDFEKYENALKGPETLIGQNEQSIGHIEQSIGHIEQPIPPSLTLSKDKDIVGQDPTLFPRHEKDKEGKEEDILVLESQRSPEDEQEIREIRNRLNPKERKEARKWVFAYRERHRRLIDTFNRIAGKDLKYHTLSLIPLSVSALRRYSDDDLELLIEWKTRKARFDFRYRNNPDEWVRLATYLRAKMIQEYLEGAQEWDFRGRPLSDFEEERQKPKIRKISQTRYDREELAALQGLAR